MIELTITAYGNVSVTDLLGLEANAEEMQFRGAAIDAGNTSVYRLSNAAWDRIRPEIRRVSQMRVPLLTPAGVQTGHTQPALEYSINPLPGRVPRITQIEQTAELSTLSDGVLTLRGINLLGGMQATLEIFSQSVAQAGGFTGSGPRFGRAVKIMRLTAVPIGPLGQKISLRIESPLGAGSVATELLVDGGVKITVVPAAAGPTATAVAAQINGDAAAARWVTAVALVGTARVPPVGSNLLTPQAPQSTPVTHVALKDGDGGGLAVLDVPVLAGAEANRLRLTAQKGGNPSNRISLIINVSQGANTVTVSDKQITVNRTTATTAIGTLATAINANASAAALVSAAAIGSGSLGALTETFLYGGSSEEIVATVGGAAAVLTAHDDNTMVLSVSAAALVAAGVTDVENVLIQLVGGSLHLQGQVQPGTPVNDLRARVRAQANVTIATPGATVDGVAMVAGQRFWSDVQTTTTEDGLWVWNGAGVPATRAPELPAGAHASGRLVSISEGTNAGIVYQVTNPQATDVVGTDNLSTAALGSVLPTVTGSTSLTGRVYLGALLATLNYVGQYAGGAAIDDAVGPFVRYHVPRTVMVVAGVGAVASNITITGINPRTGLSDTEVIAITAAGTFEGAKAWRTITRVQSNIDVVGTVDIRAGAGVYLGSAVASIDAVGVSEVYEAPAGSSSAAEGVVRFTTVPNGTQTYMVDFTRAHTHSI